MSVHFSQAKLKRVFQKMRKLRILVLGDLMLDDFIWGKVTRISPEAPVPVVHVTRESAYPGGSANVGRNLADFGIFSEMSGLMGIDPAGERLLKLLQKSKIGTRGILKKRNFPTIRKARIIARNQQVVRVDHEALQKLQKADLAKLIPFLRRNIPRMDAVIIEDYGKGFITQELVDVVTELALKHGKILAVDPNPNNPLRWQGATVVKPNRQEALSALGLPFSEDSTSIKSVGEKLLKHWGVENVLMTLGEEGMMLFRKKGKGNVYHTPTRAREVFDVSGAGDTAIAFFTAALAVGLNECEAAEIANHSAGVVVGKLGTATVSPEELLSSWTSFEE